MSEFIEQKPLILASASSIRKKLLASLGLDFEIHCSGVDEEAIKNNFRSKSWISLGKHLALAKAKKVSAENPDHYVIAADQLCIFENRLFDKPVSHEKAISQLNTLIGKKHRQIACCCVVQNNQVLWQGHASAVLHMRQLSLAEIEAYLLAEQPYQSCGSYQYEGLGKWLFEAVVGREDTILGLPLQPLSKALKDLSVIDFKKT